MPRPSLDAYKLGNEILVNTTTAGGQDAPAITALHDGGFVVSWTDASTTGGDTSQGTVRAQVFADDGSKVGGEILVPTTTLGTQNASTVTALNDGRFVIAWEDASRGAGDASGDAVRAQFFNADGTKSGNEFVLPQATFSHQGEPSLATLPDGHFVATWSDYSSNTGDPDIRAELFNADGTRARADFLVNTSTQNNQIDPAIAALPDGRFVIAWTDGSAGNGRSSIRAQVFNEDGTKAGTEFLVNTSDASSQFQPVVTAFIDGRFIVSWTDAGGTDGDGYGVLAQMFFTDGTKAGSEFVINPTTQGLQTHPGLAALPIGLLATVWGDSSSADSSGWGVRAQLFGSSLNPWGEEHVVNTTTTGAQWNPVVTVLHNGDLAVAWEDLSATGGDTSGSAIRAQILRLGGLPYISSDGGGHTASVSIDENTVAVTTVTATDPDSTSFTFSIAGGADAARFHIDPVSGALSFVAAPNFEQPNDVDHDNNYQVVVRATDDTTLHNEQAITVTVNNVNEAPPIVSNGGGDTATVSVAENTTAVTTVTAVDPEGAAVSYSLAGGADSGRFQIDGATGALSFVSPPNFEGPGSSAGTNSYEVIVRASDGTFSDLQTLTVNVTNVNEGPQITSSNGAIALENSTAAMTVEAYDPDAGTTFRYMITGGADAEFFHINDLTGALTFVQAPDFELPADANHDNYYEVAVRVTDGSLFDDKAIAVEVLDVPEQPPQVAKWGDEFLVNTTTDSSQFLPAFAGSPTGRFTATWSDGSQTGGDTSLNAVRAQLFNADGTKLAGELLANSATLGTQKDSSVTVLSDGRSLVVWTNYHNLDQPSVPYDVRGQIFNVDGTPAGSEFTLHTPTDDEWTPAVGALPGGRFVAVWAGVGDQTVVAQLFDADGTKSGTAFAVNPATAGAQTSPTITVLPHGDFVVGWTDVSGTGGDQSSTSVRAQIFHDDGTRLGDPFLLNTTTSGQQSQPAIGALADGRFVAAWTDASETGGDTDQGAIRAQIFNADGSKAEAEFLVNTTIADQQDSPTVAGLLDGRFVVAWVNTVAHPDNTWTSTVRAQAYNVDGTKLGTEFALTADPNAHQAAPTLAALADGRFVLGWADDAGTLGDASSSGIHGQIFDARDAAVHLVGTAGNDDYIGTAFNDTMRGDGGNDHLDGGAGDDTAIYLQDYDQYTLQAAAGGKVLVSGPEGNDVLVNFEHLQFAGMTIDAGNLHRPQITSNGGGDAAIVTIPENTTAVATVAATDADPGTVLHYGLAGGIDRSLFHIDDATGVLSFIAAPDFEAPADADHDNAYEVVVSAFDGKFGAEQVLNVTVTDVNEAPGGQPPGNEPPVGNPPVGTPPGNGPDFVWLTGTPDADTFTALPGNERIDALGGVDTVNFNFRLVDAHVSYAGNQVIIDGPASHTVLTGFETFVFTDGTVNNNDADPLVDDLFYYSRNHDVWNAHVDADAHYHGYGWHEGRDPSAFFDTSIYLGLNPDVKAAGIDPLIQFDQSGWKKSLPSLAFDSQHYLDANPDVNAAGIDPLAHFLQYGAQEGRQPFAPTEWLAKNGFDYVYYLQHNPDVANAGTDPLQHFETYGWKEGRNPNALFDVKGYLAEYADVKAAGLNPLDHYDQSGWHEGRSPSADFDTAAYLGHYHDVMAAGVDPLTHFLAAGVHEGRSAFADGAWG